MFPQFQEISWKEFGSGLLDFYFITTVCIPPLTDFFDRVRLLLLLCIVNFINFLIFNF